MRTAHGFWIGLLLACCCVVLAVNAAAGEPAKEPVRFGKVIEVKAEKLDEYKRLHANCWAEVEQAMDDAHIRGMSIYLRKLPDGKHYLFMYFEYIGQDLDGDMKKMADDPAVQRWWKQTDPCQEPLPDRKPGDWWADMEEVYHQR